MPEKWRTIEVPGYEDYEVSDQGRVRRIVGDRIRVLKPYLNTDGYLRVPLWRDGKRKSMYVQRLVLLTFDGPPLDDDMHACHLNAVRVDNRLENLRWGTRAENEYHKRYGADMAAVPF